MVRDFDSVLDRHLNTLLSGVRPKLTEYAPDTDEGRELASLLGVASRVHALPLPTPSAQGAAMGRARLMRAIQERAAEKATRRMRRERWLAWLRPAVTGTVAAAMAVVAITSSYAISTHSLPGSPLYGVKHASEQARLALASSPMERAQVHIELAGRRLHEAQQLAQGDDAASVGTLVAMQYETEAALSALLQAPSVQAAPMFGEIAALARRQESTLLWMQTTSSPAEQPAVAQAVVAAHDSRQTASAAQIDPQAANARTEAPNDVVAVVDFRGPVVASSPQSLSVGSRNVALASSTQVDGNTVAGATVEVRAAENSDGQLLALSVRESLPAASILRIEGRVTGAYDSTWLINGRPVVFDAKTTIIGWIAPGVDIQVEATLRADGALLARSAQRWVKVGDSEISIEGPLTVKVGQKWVVGGWSLIVDSRTFIDESRALIGAATGAQVKANRVADGTLVARSVVLMDASPAASASIRGPVRERTASLWRVGDYEIESNSATVVSGVSATGKSLQAEVLAVPSADSKLIATRIVLSSEPVRDGVAVEFNGPLAWTAGGPTVAGRVVRIGPDTVVRSGARTVSLQGMSADRTVLVRGVLLADGAVLASELSVLRQGASAEISGTIESVDGGSIVIGGQRILLDPAVEILGDETSAPASLLAVGQKVTVVGKATAPGSMLAWTVKVGSAAAKPGDNAALQPAAPTPAPSVSATSAPPGSGKPKSGPLPTGTVQASPTRAQPTALVTVTATCTGTVPTPTPSVVTGTVTATLPAPTPTPTLTLTVTPTAGSSPSPTASATSAAPTPTPSAPTATVSPSATAPAGPTPSSQAPGGPLPPIVTPTPGTLPGGPLPPAATPAAGDTPSTPVASPAKPNPVTPVGGLVLPRATTACGDAPGSPAPPGSLPEPVFASGAPPSAVRAHPPEGR